MAYNETSWVTSGTTAAVTSKGATLYAYFGINMGTSLNFAASTHYVIPFSNNYYSLGTETVVDIGTGTDPDTTFTTADTASQKAAELVPCLWYIPDNITIDSVSHLEGADAATGDTTRMHLMSYTFTSGSTSALTNGTLLAHNSDLTNAGNEQAYLSTWTVDSSSVSAGKVIVATFEFDSVTATDYALGVTVKYHLS